MMCDVKRHWVRPTYWVDDEHLEKDNTAERIPMVKHSDYKKLEAERDTLQTELAAVVQVTSEMLDLLNVSHGAAQHNGISYRAIDNLKYLDLDKVRKVLANLSSAARALLDELAFRGKRTDEWIERYNKKVGGLEDELARVKEQNTALKLMLDSKDYTQEEKFADLQAKATKAAQCGHCGVVSLEEPRRSDPAKSCGICYRKVADNTTALRGELERWTLDCEALIKCGLAAIDNPTEKPLAWNFKSIAKFVTNKLQAALRQWEGEK